MISLRNYMLIGIFLLAVSAAFMGSQQDVETVKSGLQKRPVLTGAVLVAVMVATVLAWPVMLVWWAGRLAKYTRADP